MKTGVRTAAFRIEADVTIVGDRLLTFNCESCGNRGGIVSGHDGLALYCTNCVADDNVKQRLELKPVRVEVRDE